MWDHPSGSPQTLTPLCRAGALVTDTASIFSRLLPCQAWALAEGSIDGQNLVVGQCWTRVDVHPDVRVMIMCT